MYQTTKPQSSFLQTAEDAAGAAQRHGKEALALHDQCETLKKKTKDYDAIFSTASPFLITLCCLLCAVVDVAVSADVYKELVPYGMWWLIADIGVIVLAFKTGHYMRSISREEADLIVYAEQERNPHFTAIERRNRVEKDMKRDRRIGYVLLTILGVLVAGLSYHRRVALLHESLSIVDVMPVLFLLLTALSSIHLFYVVKRIIMGVQLRRTQRKYNAHNAESRDNTAIAVHYYKEAQKMQEDTSIVSNDLAETLRRFLTNSTLNPQYARVETLVSSQETQHVTATKYIGYNGTDKHA